MTAGISKWGKEKEQSINTKVIFYSLNAFKPVFPLVKAMFLHTWNFSSLYTPVNFNEFLKVRHTNA